MPGLRVCEYLPRTARVMHKVALVRSVTHRARLHDSASIHALTGRPLDGPDRELFAPQPQFYPSYGSAVAYMTRGRAADVPFAFHNVVPTPCQGGGFLASAYDPLRVDVDAAAREHHAGALRPAPDVPPRRRGDRRRLLGGVAGAPAVGEGGGGGNGAELGTGRQMRGQNLLVARRLVEAGVPFVNVYDFKQRGQNWDAHFKGASQHKTHLLPLADQSLSALIEDLDARGLLDRTLVVAMGEFGRTPRINGEGGRDRS